MRELRPKLPAGAISIRQPDPPAGAIFANQPDPPAVKLPIAAVEGRIEEWHTDHLAQHITTEIIVLGQVCLTELADEKVPDKATYNKGCDLVERILESRNWDMAPGHHIKDTKFAIMYVSEAIDQMDCGPDNEMHKTTADLLAARALWTGMTLSKLVQQAENMKFALQYIQDPDAVVETVSCNFEDAHTVLKQDHPMQCEEFFIVEKDVLKGIQPLAFPDEMPGEKSLKIFYNACNEILEALFHIWEWMKAFSCCFMIINKEQLDTLRCVLNARQFVDFGMDIE